MWLKASQVVVVDTVSVFGRESVIDQDSLLVCMYVCTGVRVYAYVCSVVYSVVWLRNVDVISPILGIKSVERGCDEWRYDEARRQFCGQQDVQASNVESRVDISPLPTIQQRKEGVKADEMVDGDEER